MGNKMMIFGFHIATIERELEFGGNLFKADIFYLNEKVGIMHAMKNNSRITFYFSDELYSQLYQCAEAKWMMYLKLIGRNRNPYPFANVLIELQKDSQIYRGQLERGKEMVWLLSKNIEKKKLFSLIQEEEGGISRRILSICKKNKAVPVKINAIVDYTAAM